MSPESGFDQFADTYDQDLERALASTGEDKNYYAEGRARFLAGCLEALGVASRTVLDYGCGIGGNSDLLVQVLSAQELTGVDLSVRSVARARELNSAPHLRFATLGEFRPAGDMDLAYSNGVFHHIPPAERAGAAQWVRDALRPGGVFALWENNPWNPGTRYVMSNCVFDRDAIMLSPPETRRVLRQAGFEVLRTDSLFYFPHSLCWLRWMEPGFRWLPLGGQYQVLARKK